MLLIVGFILKKSGTTLQVLHNDNETILTVLEKGKKVVDELGGQVAAVVGDNHAGLQPGVTMQDSCC